MDAGACRVVQRHLSFAGGMAYGIDCLLTPPSLGGRCDTRATFDFPVSPAPLVASVEPADLLTGVLASSSVVDGVRRVLLLRHSLPPRLQTEGALRLAGGGGSAVT